MAMDGFITVDVHHMGAFGVKPLKYHNPTIITVTDVNFGLMEYNVFLDYLRKLLREYCRHVYYCIPRLPHLHLKKLFWAAAKATTPASFDISMNQIKELSPLAHKYLMDRDPTCWSRAFFEVGRNCDAVENGVCESFNSAIQYPRMKPIISMLEEIRIYVMERIYRKNVKVMKWVGEICPKIQ